MLDNSLKIKKRGEDGNKVISVRIKEDVLNKLDKISRESNYSRNELINLILQYGVENIEIIYNNNGVNFTPLLFYYLFFIVNKIPFKISLKTLNLQNPFSLYSLCFNTKNKAKGIAKAGWAIPKITPLSKKYSFV